MLKKYAVVVAVSGLVTGLAYYYNIHLKYEDYKDTLGALLNISSIIFAIIGAWIAIIYPKAIGKVFGAGNQAIKELEEATKDTSYLSELVEIVLVSALVLMAVLGIQFIYPVAKKISFFQTILYPCRIGMFFTITVMTLLQLNAVFRVILANYFFLNELRNKNNNAKVDNLHK